MNTFFRFIFFSIIVRTVTLFVLGMNVRNRIKIPLDGPAVIVANHNSHLDTLVLMSLIPLCKLKDVQAVAAADYFLKNRFLSWFSMNIIGILPIERDNIGRTGHPLAPCIEALKNKKVLIFFPEGSRGSPEQLACFKSGISLLIEEMPNVPVTPIFLHGLGKALPKGESLLVPFFCDVFVGDPISWTGERESLMLDIDQNMKKLANHGHFDAWE